MLVIFVLDVATPPDIRLHILYIFPIAAIALHCEQKSRIVAGLMLSTAFQLYTFYTYKISFDPFVIDFGTAFISALLSIFLASSIRINHMATVKLASTDPLTGLLNRRSFEAIVTLEIERQKRYGGVFSLVVIDLDGFKRLNDLDGHHVGDKALQLFADVLKEHTRQSDSITRHGGDEFAILMPNTLKPACSSLCQQLAAKAADRMAAAGYAITASIGSKTFEQSPDSFSDAMQQSDRAMYAAKAGGRNCAVCL